MSRNTGRSPHIRFLDLYLESYPVQGQTDGVLAQRIQAMRVREGAAKTRWSLAVR